MSSEDPSEHSASYHVGSNASGHNENAGDHFQPNPFLAELAGLFQQLIQNVTPNQDVGPRVFTLEKLKKNGASIFLGKIDDTPDVAEFWLEQTTRVLEDLQVPQADRPRLAISLLQHGAYDWWKSVLLRPDVPHPMTWAFFEARFLDQFVPAWYQEERKRAFMDVKQGSMSVSEYAYEFLRLSKYARDMVRTEEDKCRKYEYGLNSEVAGQIIAMRHMSFTSLVDSAQRLEGWHRHIGGRGNSSTDAPSGQSSHKRQHGGSEKSNWSKKGCNSQNQSIVASNQPRPQASSVGARPLCKFCEKNHTGECRRATGACFRCGQQGHMLRDCPNLNQEGVKAATSTTPGSRGQPNRKGNNTGGNSETVNRPGPSQASARVYAMHGREEQPDHDVIQG
ncbi:unnamed protein product [Cuscuta epithymum]|nr:unnamed protein product [Cuscuta epithymum]